METLDSLIDGASRLSDEVSVLLLVLSSTVGSEHLLVDLLSRDNLPEREGFVQKLRNVLKVWVFSTRHQS